MKKVKSLVWSPFHKGPLLPELAILAISLVLKATARQVISDDILCRRFPDFPLT
jgi:hypothetical protein